MGTQWNTRANWWKHGNTAKRLYKYIYKVYLTLSDILLYRKTTHAADGPVAVTELFAEKDINLYIYVYISLWRVWERPIAWVASYRACRFDSILPLGKQNFKEGRISSCVFPLLLHDICFRLSNVSHSSDPTHSGWRRSSRFPALYRPLTAYLQHVLEGI